MAGELCIAGISDALELVSKADAVIVLLIQNPVERVKSGVGARPHHRRLEARALFVGPADDFQRATRRDVAVV